MLLNAMILEAACGIKHKNGKKKFYNDRRKMQFQNIVANGDCTNVQI